MIYQAPHPVLEIHDLTVAYNRLPALWDIDMTLPQGTITGIIGPNGAGKSTLLKSMMGLVEPSSGYVRLFDQPIDKVRHKVSYVPQKESVDWDFPASVYDVVMMGRYGNLGLFKKPKKADHDAVKTALDKVQIRAYSNKQISQLSGGQQQRVFIARALAQESDLYLMDEPFAGVDASTEKAIIDLLHYMVKEEGKSVVVVHHDLQSAGQYFQWIVLLNMRLVACGPTKDVFTPSLLEETYGGKLTLLSRVGDLMKEEAFPNRENT